MARITPDDLEKLLKQDDGLATHDWRASMLEGSGEAKSHEGARLLSQYDQAVVEGDANAVQKLLEQGADANAVIFGEPVLNKALRYRREEVAEQLLKAGADANRTYEGRPLLMETLGSPRLLRMMLDAGAKIDVVTRWGGPLAAAAQLRADESVGLLLK